MAALQSLWALGLDGLVPLFGELSDGLSYFSTHQGEPKE